MKALYRKYRPIKLSDVVGQEQVTKPLAEALRSGKISHAYIFIGPRGSGKTSVARILAHEINDFKYEVEDSYTDIIEIDAASNTGVDNIRELREKAVIAPAEGKYKVYIIDEVHMLSKSAFNALLKTLEEPPKHVVFIMATTDAYKIPVTITSRAQVYNFGLADKSTMLAHLQKICKNEKINIDDEALEVVIEKGGGSFRDTISLLDQISTIASNSQSINCEMVISVLGLPESTIISNLLTAYEQGDTDGITNEIKSVLNSGIKPETLAENLIKAILEQPKPAYIPLLEKLPDVAAPFPEAKLLLAFLEHTAIRPSPLSSTRSATSKIPKVPSAPVMKASTNAPAPTEKTSADTTVSTEKIVADAPMPTTKMSADVSTSDGKPSVDFSWKDYVSKVREQTPIVAASLAKSNHQLSGARLIVLPAKNFDRKILNAKNNLEILNKSLPAGITLDITDDQNAIKKDEKLANISAIMGNVQEVDDNGIPF
ncbi:DNA polymerase III subunit gamma/tau [Candidatus Saccharibacteria bacterium]|nr:DNA polymerase III subunit gamma/tau [Candidatus Saccharibacteria bacterium]